MAKKRGMKPIPLEKQFPNDKATIEWLRSQSKNTLSAYKSLWQWFLEYTEMNGNQILESRKQDLKQTDEKLRRKWEKKALEFYKWCQTHTCRKHKKPLSEGGAKTTLGTVRGFFNYHYADLKFRNTTRRKLAREPKRIREDYKLSKETLARMSVQANLRDRYVLVVGKSLGLRAIDFINLQVGDFTCLDLDSEPPISMGERHTIKEDVPSFSFLDSDAVPILKAYLETIDRTDPNAKMLPIGKNELTRILQDLAQKANVNVGNKHLRFHCLRKFLIDRLSSQMSESKWKQVVGKKIDESAYISEVQLRESYARAMPETTFSNHNHRVMQIQELESALVKLQQDVTNYKTTSEVLGKEVKTLKETLSEVNETLREGETTKVIMRHSKEEIRHIEAMIKIAKVSRELEPQVSQKYEELINQLEEQKTYLKDSLKRLEKLL